MEAHTPVPRRPARKLVSLRESDLNIPLRKPSPAETRFVSKFTCLVNWEEDAS